MPFVACFKHKDLKSTSATPKCKDCVILESIEKFPNGKLPDGKQVMSYYLQLKHVEIAEFSPAHVAIDLMLHWVNCNLYTVSRKTVTCQINDLMEEFEKLKRYARSKKQNQSCTYYERLKKLKEKCDSLFDIKCVDPARLKRQEKLWGVNTIDNRKGFGFFIEPKRIQIVKYMGYCTTCAL